MSLVIRVFAMIAILTLATFHTFAQSISGDITGIVTDSSGAGVANATVTAENQGTAVKGTTTTGDDGVCGGKSAALCPLGF